MSARSHDKDPFVHQDKACGMTRSNFEPSQVETSSVDPAEIVSKERTCIYDIYEQRNRVLIT